MLLSGRMLFPVFGSTEKVDKVASKLLAGRVAVFVDGSPFVLTAPYVFAESLQSAEDYLKNPVYATAMRLLRVLALLLSLYFPAMYITVLKYGARAASRCRYGYSARIARGDAAGAVF